jgi:hypothetical protein
VAKLPPEPDLPPEPEKEYANLVTVLSAYDEVDVFFAAISLVLMLKPLWSIGMTRTTIRPA